MAADDIARSKGIADKLGFDYSQGGVAPDLSAKLAAEQAGQPVPGLVWRGDMGMGKSMSKPMSQRQAEYNKKPTEGKSKSKGKTITNVSAGAAGRLCRWRRRRMRLRLPCYECCNCDCTPWL